LSPDEGVPDAPAEADVVVKPEEVALDELSRTPGLNTNDPSLVITVTFKLTDGITDCSTLVDPTVAAPCFANVRVQYTFHTVTPWPLIPNTALFDRTTAMRTFRAPQP